MLCGLLEELCDALWLGLESRHLHSVIKHLFHICWLMKSEDKDVCNESMRGAIWLQLPQKAHPL